MLTGCYFLKDIQYFLQIYAHRIFGQFILYRYMGSKIQNIPTWTGIYLVLKMQTTKKFQV